jgi:nitroreductase
MEVFDAIKKRRSIRKYLDKPVLKDAIVDLLEAARLAPSAYNAQPWKFLVVNNKKVIDGLKKESVFAKDFVYTAPVIVICCGVVENYPARAKDNFNLRELALGDISIASQNLVLRATELGLGTCYIGLLDREKLKKILKIPDNYIIPYVISVGYHGEEPSVTPRKSLDDISRI